MIAGAARSRQITDEHWLYKGDEELIGTKSIAAFLIGFLCAGCLTACTEAITNQQDEPDMEDAEKTVLEMDMNANYSDSDPFENGRLFCVSENLETLEAQVSFQMDGGSGIVEIKERNADEVLWRNTWNESVECDAFTVSLNNLLKEKEYVVRFTGTQINHAVVKVVFESGLVQEKERPSQ